MTPSVASAVLFASLGLVALAFWLIVRRYSASAVVIGLAGLFTLTASSTWFTQAAQRGDECAGCREKIVDLEQRLSASVGQSEAMRSERDKALREADALRADKTRLAAAWDNERAEFQKRINADATEIKGLKAKNEDLKAEIVTLKTPPPPIDLSGKITQLRGHLSKSHQALLYSAEPLPSTKLVAGLEGSWYKLRLARDGKPLTFPDRQYSIPGASPDIVKSARELNELFAPLQQAKVAMRLFVRGMADKRQVDKASTRPAGIIAVLPQTNGIHSGTRTETLPVVDNEALPNLRAEWMRQQLRPVMSSVGTRDIEILDNQPSDGSELAVDLLLFVDWR